jgi:MoxR-like ATPase
MAYPFYTRECRDISLDEASGQEVDHPSGYLPDPNLVDAVNVALLLNRPLLLTGEPGTGKTQLACSVAWQLAGRRLLNIATEQVEKFETKSSSSARDLFYTFDTIRRFHSAQSGGSAENVDYITFNALGRAILNALPLDTVRGVLPRDFVHVGPTRCVVLIDEIDKAPRDFPNDLLNEMEQMYFKIPELNNVQLGGKEQLSDAFRPIVIITSNSERNLPDPFLRRCIYYDIPFPTEAELSEILLNRLPHLNGMGRRLPAEATAYFLKLRNEQMVRRRISPAELIQWLTFMLARGAAADGSLKNVADAALEGLGALTKDPVDQQRVREDLKRYLGISE